MDLSAEQFIELAGAASTLAVDAQGHEERRRPRSNIEATATLIPLCDRRYPPTLNVRVRDLSASGVGFLFNRQMELDEQFALLLPRENDTPALVLCAVAFWQPLARDLFAIGARFTRVLRDGGDPRLPVVIDDSIQELVNATTRHRRTAS